MGKKIVRGDLDILEATPAVNFKDTSCTDDDINASIEVQATDTGSGTEDVDLAFKQMIAGVLTTFWAVDADGDLNFQDRNLVTTGTLAGASLNTGHGVNELYAMDQDVETTDAVTFATVDTGQGANELYAMDQDVEQADSPTFVTTDLTGITDGNIPNMAAGGAGFENSPISTDGIDVGIGTTTPAGKPHTVLSAGHPAIFGGDVIATLTGVSISNANPSVLTKDATIDDGLAVGDAVIVNSGTNATVGTYFVASIVVNTSVTLDRQAATGACADGNITYVNDPMVIEVSRLSGKPRIILPVYASTVIPTLAFGSGKTGITAYDNNQLNFIINGKQECQIDAEGLKTAVNEASLYFEVMTATNPGFVSGTDPDTGMAIHSADHLSLIAGAIEGQRIVEANSIIYNLFGVTQVNSQTNQTSSGDTNLTSSATGTYQVGDVVLVWSGTTVADYGVYYITAIPDGFNITVNRALTGSDADVDYYVLRNGMIQTGAGVQSICVPETVTPQALADHAFLYAKDVGGTGNMFVADAAADETQISSHNFSLFTPDLAEQFPWSFYAENKALGVKINVDMAGMVRAVEALSGKKFIYYEDIPKSVDLEQAYKVQWKNKWINENTIESEVTNVEAFEMVEIDVPTLYDVEVIDEKTGKIKVVKQKKKIDEKIIGYELNKTEVKPKVDIIYETHKEQKSQLKESIRFDETNGKFFKTVIPNDAQAEEATKEGFEFEIPAWIADRLK